MACLFIVNYESRVSLKVIIVNLLILAIAKDMNVAVFPRRLPSDLYPKRCTQLCACVRVCVALGQIGLPGLVWLTQLGPTNRGQRLWLRSQLHTLPEAREEAMLRATVSYGC